MTVFNLFQERLKPSAKCMVVDEAKISKYKNSFPPDLIEFWIEEGWCSFENGLFWIDNPANYTDILHTWLGDKGNAAIGFGHSAFGHLLLWYKGRVHLLNPHFGTLSPYSSILQIFFNINLCDEDFLKNIFYSEIFLLVQQRLGSPSSDECYAFLPALALGGNVTSERVELVKFKEHSLFLAQLQS